MGSNGIKNSEPTKKAPAASTVTNRFCKHQRLVRMYQRISAPSCTLCSLASGFSIYAAIMGVSIRATMSDVNTANAAVQPNCLKNLPTIPLMKAVGKNTAISVKVMAITATPISSAASIAAWYGDLPIRRWRTMFSTSTMASSTKIPMTRLSASSVTTLMEKPK